MLLTTREIIDLTGRERRPAQRRALEQWEYPTVFVQTDRPQSCEQPPKQPSAMRPRKTDRHLPSCVYQRHGAYWLVKRGKWTRLAADLPAALAEYARIISHATGGMPALIEETLPAILSDKRPPGRRQVPPGRRSRRLRPPGQPQRIHSSARESHHAARSSRSAIIARPTPETRARPDCTSPRSDTCGCARARGVRARTRPMRRPEAAG